MAFGMQGEQLPWVPEVRDQLRFFRTYRILSEKLMPTRQRFSAPPPKLKGTKPVVLGQMTQTQWRAADEALINNGEPTDSVYQALHRRLEENLRAIVDAAIAQGTEVYIITTVPHLDYPPFYDANSPDLVEKDIQAYTQKIGKAKQLISQRQWSEMIEVLNEAIDLEPNHATAHHLLGSAYNGQREYAKAWYARENALMLDISRKRTLPSYATVAKDLCSKTNCETTSLYPWFQNAVSQRGFVVFQELYGDHEHLNPIGITLVAEHFTEMIAP